ncbi:hypothetical protein, partial [Klebsiella pneumoniae]|uniref:hypothetical protein n=1 Tax=Klebsiella pneumoniae TaxID=573 RepID=UPI003EE316E9
VHFPNHERKLLSVFYTLTEDIIPWRDEEGRIWDQLAVLEGPPRHVGESEIATLRYSVILARRLAYLIQLNAGRQLRRAHE